MTRPNTVRRRNTSGEPLTGGPALRQAIHVARARTSIDSDTQLALAAGVHYDTLMNWYSGRTTPRPHAIRKVAAILGVPYGDLLAA
jgi:transcriptional regulator with XRE-family HTH domain